ncbi:tripartite tricarboxylate transporter permease [Desulfovibrio litoralis]|uniref:Putative tricarboxylic transport membrane protein n=1 Tax=Desulfovibrio litoralis DSM 11393 TaxID=1121455 RepID=A0A1M7T3M4_9BACT|nr:tripartite tricarboxylate transporter permease [Desulfovibrio litoralis]SHN65350.1 putative tricarboxylic transport membrane protein [Desulfovibrio litoralis DSM 11393]
MNEFILPALGHLCEPLNIFLIIVGLIGGIIVGALPGLTATMGVALMVPMTFSMNSTSGLIMLGAIYIGAIYGGSNSACLICTPGTPSSVATTWDGWPLSKSGKADTALYASLQSSAFGGLIGALFLLFAAKPLAMFSLNFQGPESFWLCIFGLSTIAVMSSGNMLKGLLSGALGLLLSTIGIDPLEGVDRFTFGYYPLVQGIAVIPAMIGLFSFSQVLVLVASKREYVAEFKPKPGVFSSVSKYLFTKCKRVLLVSSGIGSIVGMLPGAGGEIASIIAYNEAKRWDKEPERYGKGVIEGVAASESANNAVIGGSLIPMLTLGIPGSAVAAVILGALLAKGIQPGFKVFTDTGDLAYTFMLSQVFGNILLIPVGYFIAKIMARLLNIKLNFVAVTIVVLSVIGSYAINNSILDIWVVILFGIIGFFGGRIGFDTGAMALGIILGPMIEENLGKCFDLSRSTGSLASVFFGSTTAVVLIILTIVSCLTPLLLAARKKARTACENKAIKDSIENKEITIVESEITPETSGRSDLIAGLSFLGVALAFYFEGRGIEGVGAIFPLGLQIFLGIGGVLLILLGVKKSFSTVKDGFVATLPRVLVILGASIVYAFLVETLGFFTASFVFMVFASWYLGDQSKSFIYRLVVSLIAASLVCALIWLSFVYLLGVPTPEGLFF